MVFILLGLALAAAFVWFQNSRFEARVSALRDQVTRPEAPSAARVELPAIVSAYATRAGGRPGGPGVVHLQHRAQLTTDRNRPPIAVEADQWLSSYRSGIVWHGRGRMFGLPVSVVDSFVAGSGLLEARLLGTFTVARAIGAAADKGELQRYLSELPLHPDAILNNTELTWRQLDDRTVEVVANTSGGPAGVQFFFDESGDIVALLAPDRPMTVGSTTVPTPWRGEYRDYRQFGAYRIPSHGEVSWLLADGPFTYWRGDIIAYQPLDAGSRAP